MLQRLEIINVGPAKHFTLELGSRLNVFTGDNGLGKSFLLDIAWWAVTRKWPAEVNKNLPVGLMARPAVATNEAKIDFTFMAKSTTDSYVSEFDREKQAWTGRPGRPGNPGLVLYAQMDGSFAVWDPARNYWRNTGDMDVQDRPPAYVFSPREVWNGLVDEERGLLCNGLIADWAGWQKEKGAVFRTLRAVIKALSPSNDEPLEPGELTKIGLDDPRDIPTLKMPYGESVPVLHASAGIRRIIALAYLLVWSWQEHVRVSALTGKQKTSQVIFLIDEIEAHLHPKWQRTIIKALLAVVGKLTDTTDVQLLASTHSPLVLASLEPMFDAQKDAWFDLDLLVDNEGHSAKVELERRQYVRQGDASNWLTSKAFDLDSARSEEAERVLNKASVALSNEDFDAEAAKYLDAELHKVLGETDPFWTRWRYVAEKKGWLK